MSKIVTTQALICDYTTVFGYSSRFRQKTPKIVTVRLRMMF